MQEFMVTFGVKYAREKHPVFAEAHPDGWVTIEAADYEAARAFVVRWLGSAWAFLYPAGDFDASYHPTGELRRVRADEQHIVYAFASGSFGSLGDEAWIAIADDGEVVAQHISSSRTWGQHDVGPTGFYRRNYVDKWGEDFEDRIDYRVLPEGEAPPDEVRERNAARAEAGESA